MTTTYYSPFFPPLESVGAKGSTVPVITTAIIQDIRQEIVDTAAAAVDYDKIKNMIEEAQIGDFDPPAPVNGLVLSSTIVTDDNGNQITTLVANWTPAPEADVIRYDLAIRENGGTFIEYVVGGSASEYRWQVRSNSNFSVRIRAIDKGGNVGGWSPIVSLMSARDTVPPAPPSSFDVRGVFGGFRLSWLNPSDSDLEGIIIWEGLSGDFTQANTLTVTNAVPNQPGLFSRTALNPGVTRYYWIAARDSSGNVSTKVGPISKVTTSIAFTDFDLSVQPIGKVDALPSPIGYVGPLAVILSTDKKLYRYKDGAWNKDVDGSDLTAGSVRAYAIAAQQITARELAIADFQNLILNFEFTNDPDLAMPAAWTRRVLASDNNNVIEVARLPNGGWPAPAALRFRRHLATNAGELSIMSGNYDSDQDTAMLGGVATDLNEEFYFQAPIYGSNGAKLSVELVVRTSPTNQVVSSAIQIPLAQDFTTRSGVLKNTTGKGRAYFKFSHVPNSATANDSEIYLYTPLISRRNGGKLIVDGAIYARQLNVEDIFAQNIFANRFTGGEFRTDASLPGTISIGATGVTIGTVKDKALAALDAINNIGSDNIISRGEKSDLIQQWRAIGDETNIIYNQSVAQGLWNSQEKYDWDNARDSLANYLNSLSPAWDDVSQDTPVNGNTLRDRFVNYYNKRQTLLSRMTRYAQEIANDPAPRINANTTQIDPGRILISGSTTLANWRAGGDYTQINGGALAANSVTANKLTVGNRGINVVDLVFYTSSDKQTLYWTEGYVQYIDDNGNRTQVYVAAGSTNRDGYVYVYWSKGGSSLGSTTDPSGFSNPDVVNMCTWFRGSTFINPNYSTTIIDGANIATKSVTADKVNVGSLSAISATIGLLRTSTTGQRVEITDNLIRVFDSNNTLRVRMGVL
jgi:hypothetical protein